MGAWVCYVMCGETLVMLARVFLGSIARGKRGCECNYSQGSKIGHTFGMKGVQVCVPLMAFFARFNSAIRFQMEVRTWSFML